MKIFCRKGGGLIVSLPFRRRCFCSPPRGGRRQINTFDRQFSIFLLTPREGGDQLTLFSRVSLNLFLLTPPRGGRRSPAPVCTHAGYHFYSRPAWGGRPRSIALWAPCGCYFYSRPREGGDDSEAFPRHHNSVYFYSRPRVGGDQGIGSDSADKRAISTHAPAWGATVMPKNSSMEIPRFLLTPQNRGRTHRCSTPQAETGV